ncbi:potassium-transporting ATPase subunit KdpC [Paenibacillus durus]|uniref:Potassium-transporting ATPase KdpC subunit n=1 Tax=Paenibacillus durus TaxID=44251 RepID=A0A089HPQ1_PAEDU|nr:potassium-transporting ATPase subunit KdpC [Paenibacillus durus]AIQ12348.1 potassium-transporting ATPase subunit C [Paenibacillus durus]
MRLVAASLRTSLMLMVLCGLLYNLSVTGIAQLVWPKQAGGSLVYNGNGDVIGSALIGQSFTDLKFFQGRVSSIDYHAEGSGSPNFAPSNPDLLNRVKQSVEDWRKNNPDVPISQLPVDLITNSGSGLDPDISPEAAKVQIPRISKLTGIPPQELESLVNEHTEGRKLSFLGEPAVNVLKLNIALEKLIAH